MTTLIIVGVFFVCMCFAFCAGIAVEARYGKNKYLAELAVAGESLLPATPTPAITAALVTPAATPAFSTPVATPPAT